MPSLASSTDPSQTMLFRPLLSSQLLCTEQYPPPEPGSTYRIPPRAFSTLISPRLFCPCSALSFLSCSRFKGIFSARACFRSFSVEYCRELKEAAGRNCGVIKSAYLRLEESEAGWRVKTHLRRPKCPEAADREGRRHIARDNGAIGESEGWGREIFERKSPGICCLRSRRGGGWEGDGQFRSDSPRAGGSTCIAGNFLKGCRIHPRPAG